MSDTKSHQFRPPLYHENGSRRDKGTERTAKDPRREQQGWEAYRKWLSSMNGRPRTERAPLDHSVYSWKGYHNWADRVRQSWEPEDS
ncbi:MAG: hypothetical protein R3305_08025 [Gammaproteobacteria bacterium]|nr:hypothetical protein [Gammaproteobacteria bacterium]